MSVLTRRRDPDTPDCWHVYYGDVQVGMIAVRLGVPDHVHQWGWNSGFLLTAATAAEARPLR